MPIHAVLAPTNTGKTHRAVERMLEHDSGMIGLPLRLLAREVYDRVTSLRGENQVALVTGEEKRIPSSPRYWVCTVESMPISRAVDFVAVDEIQLAAHHRRGHVFTDRLLNARGRQETWFMGAETIRQMVETLVPEAKVRRHPRLSQLRHAGMMSLRSLPPRSAVVAFSATRVYELAERLRQRRGGVAVVLGALSPRTRNAQVALYQSGEVQYLVATDAIGMGMNLDVDHIAFAGLRKFDGQRERLLEVHELAQIAGRAGRYQRDGTFGTLAPLPSLSNSVFHSIENHRFEPVQRLVWRNSRLDMRSVDALIASLARRPDHSVLKLVDYAEDYSALVKLASDDEIRRRCRGQDAVALLWEVCQIPDFRKLLEDSHVRLLGAIYRQLTGKSASIDVQWMSQQVSHLDETSGDIDTLMRRIAFVRTWTYISYHTHWVADAEGWQERTRAIEDRLSDALHDRLVQRFVARQQQKRPRAIAPADRGNPFAKLRGLLGDAEYNQGERAIEQMIAAEHGQFHVDSAGTITFDDRAIARMSRGVDLLRPEVTLLIEELGAGAHSRVLRRMIAWVRDLVAETLAPLRRDRASELSPAGRGLVYQLEQGLGTVLRRQARAQLRDLDARDRDILASLDVRIGRCTVYVPSLLSPRALQRRAALVSASLPTGVSVALPPAGATSFTGQTRLDPGLHMAIGYPLFGPRAIRADIAEKAHRSLTAAARRASPFSPPRQLARWLGCPAETLPEVIVAFGYRALDDGRFSPRWRRRKQRSARADSKAGR
ncbi:MAG: helicase [Proteobacteria bacterium]|nr:helicase [Pseudomonadota bacterium]